MQLFSVEVIEFACRQVKFKMYDLWIACWEMVATEWKFQLWREAGQGKMKKE